MKTTLLIGIGLVAALAQAGVDWKNLGAENQLGGRKTSVGYLTGKVVMVCKDASQAPRMEAVWQSFKSKPFVLIGAWEKKADACTFPMYGGAGLAEGEPETPFYVVGETGKVVYKGSDERMATEAVVTALTDRDSPRSLAQWKELLDFEFENLPGHAYNRMAAFKRKYPSSAKEYDAKVKELRALKGVDKVAKLIALAKQAKDVREFGPKKKMQQDKFVKNVKAAISKNASLKDEVDPKLLQEVKNSLADLKWTEIAFSR